jgi:hypothetical protein
MLTQQAQLAQSLQEQLEQPQGAMLTVGWLMGLGGCV